MSGKSARMKIRGTSLSRTMDLIGTLERNDITPKVSEILALLQNFYPPNDNRSLSGATSRQIAFISDLSQISSDDDTLVNFLEVLTEVGGLDSAQAGHLIDALKTPQVIVPEQIAPPEKFNPHNLTPKSTLLLLAILEAGGDKEYVSKDLFAPLYNRRVSPTEALNPGSLVNWLRGLDQRRGLVLWTRDVLNPVGYRLGTVHTRLTNEFLQFLEDEGVHIQDLVRAEDRV